MRQAFLFLFVLLCCSVLLAQQKVITGTIKNAKGEPLIGATVRQIGGGNSATQTNATGSFSLPLKGNAKSLEITFVGYKDQTIALSGQADIAISMEEASQAMQDVVVVGYGTVKKKDLTGSVSSINSDHLNLGGTTANIGQAIQGRAAGVVVQAGGFSTPGTLLSIKHIF